MQIRQAKVSEAETLAAMEYLCFPENEATPFGFNHARVQLFSEMFLVAVDEEDNPIAMINGVLTNKEAFEDCFFTDIEEQDPSGRNIMLLGLEVLPQYQGQGIGTQLMKAYLKQAKANNIKKVYLTCLKEKISYYEKLGFSNKGLSKSKWGNETWYDMCIEVNEL